MVCYHTRLNNGLCLTSPSHRNSTTCVALAVMFLREPSAPSEFSAPDTHVSFLGLFSGEFGALDDDSRCIYDVYFKARRECLFDFFVIEWCYCT